VDEELLDIKPGDIFLSHFTRNLYLIVYVDAIRGIAKTRVYRLSNDTYIDITYLYETDEDGLVSYPLNLFKEKRQFRLSDMNFDELLSRMI